MIPSRSWAAVALFATAAAAAPAAYDKPWSLVESGDGSQTRQEYSVAITQVDGQSTRNPRASEAIEPGKHRVTVRFETARVQQGKAETTRDLQIELEPCTRYRIVAKRTTSTGTQWEPKVYSEAIGECKRKFKS